MSGRCWFVAALGVFTGMALLAGCARGDDTSRSEATDSQCRAEPWGLIRVGMTPQQVVQLVGDPDGPPFLIPKGPPSDSGVIEMACYRYYPNARLLVEFDVDWKVKKVIRHWKPLPLPLGK
jgi:hypothetical protein